jgi:phosphatidylserine/phosphatidylglycerophosphate/cardiolipin synthase-like enzyme
MLACQRSRTASTREHESRGTGSNRDVALHDWFLTAEERGNPATELDRRHADGLAWTLSNAVRPLVHGKSYFAELHSRIDAMGQGDRLLFTNWRGDPDELLDDPGSEVSTVLCAAAKRGVEVKGLIWRSHLDRFRFSAEQNRTLAQDVALDGGQVVLDMRVRVGGSHHQKFVVLRHPSRPQLDVAYVGGIDLGHSRRDDIAHQGDPQRQPMAAVYGPRPPWHDIQVEIRGPAVADVETVFRERWNDPAPLIRNPISRLRDKLQHVDRTREPLDERLPDPAPCGTQAVQLLRTYPHRRGGYPFAPRGERSVARGYAKVLERAQQLIYIEDQYLWSVDVARTFAQALRKRPTLRVIAVVPHHPDQDGRISRPPNLLGRSNALRLLSRAGGDRVAVYGIENHSGTPVYVHAKVCVIDDVWAAVGSDNFNRRSWTHDSELGCAVIDDAVDERDHDTYPRPSPAAEPARRYARELRLMLSREHLDRAEGDDADLIDPESAFAAFARSASELDAWCASGRTGVRPRGRLRPYQLTKLSRWTRLWAGVLYRLVYDPDGRPWNLRRTGRF